MSRTEAQEEFQRFSEKNNQRDDGHLHPEDRLEQQREAANLEGEDFQSLDEEDQHRNDQINAAMRMPTLDQAAANGFDGIKLPPASFDRGRATGVKGVIADARSYEMARKQTFMSRMRQARRNMFGVDNSAPQRDSKSDSEEDQEDEENFLAQWRESRRRELESETRTGSMTRTRRTSPSARIYGRFDVVDALGYLDAIEKVGRETVVVVFVYDDECPVTHAVETALAPLVSAYPTVHFVKVHYEDIEFDNAAVPAILAYRNQGDLFANLTGLIEMLPSDDEASLTSEAMHKLLRSNGIL